MSDYLSRAELLKEINLAEWKDERDKAEARYIATHLDPAPKQKNCAFIDLYTQQLRIDIYDFHISLSERVYKDRFGNISLPAAIPAAGYEFDRFLSNILKPVYNPYNEPQREEVSD